MAVPSLPNLDAKMQSPKQKAPILLSLRRRPLKIQLINSSIRVMVNIEPVSEKYLERN